MGAINAVSDLFNTVCTVARYEGVTDSGSGILTDLLTNDRIEEHQITSPLFCIRLPPQGSHACRSAFLHPYAVSYTCDRLLVRNSPFQKGLKIDAGNTLQAELSPQILP